MWSFGVPNVPCGVERRTGLGSRRLRSLFLMYRVELKAIHGTGLSTALWVPNVPCGVERWAVLPVDDHLLAVPNVPCGVESTKELDLALLVKGFLMYRVELKETRKAVKRILREKGFLMYRVELKGPKGAVIQGKSAQRVPNVPCGVESRSTC